MTDTWNIYNELAKLGIALKIRKPGKVYMTCPKCSPTRRKKKSRCLEVVVLRNELRAYWRCFHPDCKGWTVTEIHKPFGWEDNPDAPRTPYQGSRSAQPRSRNDVYAWRKSVKQARW